MGDQEEGRAAAGGLVRVWWRSHGQSVCVTLVEEQEKGQGQGVRVDSQPQSVSQRWEDQGEREGSE